MLNEMDKQLLSNLGLSPPLFGLPDGWIKISDIRIPNFKYRNLDERFLESPEGELKEIEDDIKDRGLQNKIILNRKFELVDGFLRIKAFQLLGYSIIPFTISDKEGDE